MVVPQDVGRYRTKRNWRTHASRTTSAAPVIAGRGQHSLIEARPINRLTDSPERIQPPLATLTLVEEVPDRLFDQFIGAPIAAASEFLLNLLSQVR